MNFESVINVLCFKMINYFNIIIVIIDQYRLVQLLIKDI